MAAVMTTPQRSTTPVFQRSSGSQRHLLTPPTTTKVENDELNRKLMERRQKVEGQQPPASQHVVVPQRATYPGTYSPGSSVASIAKQWPPRPQAPPAGAEQLQLQRTAPQQQLLASLAGQTWFYKNRGAARTSSPLPHRIVAPAQPWMASTDDNRQMYRAISGRNLDENSYQMLGHCSALGSSVSVTANTVPTNSIAAPSVQVSSVPAGSLPADRIRRHTAPFGSGKAEEEGQSQIKQLQDSLEQSEHINEQLRNDSRRLHQDKETVKMHLHKSQRDNEILQKQQQRLVDDMQQQNDRINEWQKSYSELEQGYANLQERLQVMDMQISSGRIQMIAVETENTQLHRQIEELTVLQEKNGKADSLVHSTRLEKTILETACRQLHDSLTESDAQREALSRQLNDRVKERNDLSLANQQLRSEMQVRQEEVEHLRRQGDQKPEDCASRLRHVMTKRDATTAEMQDAIAAVQALINEAQRELSAKQHRERRAAFEQLYKAMEQGHDEELARAVAEAKRTECSSEDVQKAEAKLEELRSMTDEQRAAKALHEISVQKRQQAFIFVKRDSEDKLEDLLENLEQGIKWRDWRDHSGRSLWQASKELKAPKVQVYLAAQLGMQIPVAAVPVAAPAPTVVSKDLLANQRPMKAAPELKRPTEDTSEKPSCAVPVLAASEPTTAGSASSGTTDSTPTVDPWPSGSAEQLVSLAPDEEATLKTQAFRAVVKDDVATLLEVLERAPQHQWSVWRNRADKDLLTLSEERGSSNAYGALAKALGITQEAKRLPFAEGECVWVMLPGEVQAVRASVLEDAPEELDEIYVEFWDGDDPKQWVERCLVLKSDTRT